MTKHSSDPMKRKVEGERKSSGERCCAYKTEYSCSPEICPEIVRGEEGQSPRNSQIVQEIIIWLYTNMCMCVHIVCREKGGGEGKKSERESIIK